MRVKLSQGSTASSTRLSEGPRSLCSRLSVTALTISHLWPWSMRKLCACMVVSPKTCIVSSKSKIYQSQRMCQIAESSQIFYGMTPTTTWETGRRTREAADLCSEESSWKNSLRGMTSIWFAEDIKSWKMVTVSLERTSNWLRSFRPKTIAAISTMMLPWWTWIKT